VQTIAGSYFYHNFRLTKSFFGKKLTISAITFNPFAKRLDFTTTQETPDFYYKIHRYEYRRRWVAVSASYRFGEMKAKIKKAQRTIKNDDAMDIEDSERQ
jgi:hypothetical protein